MHGLSKRQLTELTELTRRIDVRGVFTLKELRRERKLRAEASPEQINRVTSESQIVKCTNQCCREKKPFYY